jgi:transcription elongation factor Elf1
MTGATITPRGRYTLDDAARIHRTLMITPDTADCPKCGSALSLIASENRNGSVWFVRCETCQRSIVLDQEHVTG